ncbi:MAG: glycosyl transferase [Chlorobiaceae bacterium]|nr:glycosyl transferase [Chlorobiaceae bacterium]
MPNYDGIITSALIYPLIASAGISGALVLTKSLHGRFSLDNHEGVQKFHTVPTPRIGGIALFASLVVASLLSGSATGGLLGLMIIAGLPAFISGIIEDLTKRVGVRERLLATICSGLLAIFITGYKLDYINVPGFDTMLAYAPCAIAFTAFAVGGVANAINIIDGFNGLAGGVLMICFGTMGLIAFQVGDMQIVNICLISTVCVAGFMLLNFPFGKIFMGDGGAYFMGFMVAWIAVMLPMRNPQVSPWAPIVACAYPIIETIVSMIRRSWQRTGTGKADSAHLHSLIKINIIRRMFPDVPQHLRNAMVSPLCWLITLTFSVPAFMFYRDTRMLMLTAVCCLIVYVLFYNGVTQLNPVNPDQATVTEDGEREPKKPTAFA